MINYIYKLTLITIFIIIWQCAFAQNEPLIIDGSLVISDSQSPNPLAGTIRWTGQDFETFDGTMWKSLTCDCDDDSDVILNCPTSNFVQDNCTFTVNWTHNNPLSTTVNYDLRINGVDPGLSVTYPATSNTIDLCSTLGINSGSGTLDVELFYWYDGDTNAMISAGTCTVNYDLNPSNECMTYAQIRAAGRSENCYNRNSPDSHLAEFLYMNPTVSRWTNDPVNETICAVAAPEPGPSALMAPAPSGGDDAPDIEAFINANPGAEIVGRGTYKFGSTIDINVPVKIWDMPSTLINSVGITYRVKAPNVEIYRSPIDAKNLPSAYIGWRVEKEADNFVLSTSGISNIWHKSDKSGAGVLIAGANNFRISCNEFNNLINDTSDKTHWAIMRAVWSASYTNIPSGEGYVANNNAENIQSNGKLYDGEFFCLQGYHAGSTGKVRVIANRCVNAGKRLTKWQHPDGFVASNFWHLRDRDGSLGIRKNNSVVNCQLDADRITAVNNRIKIETEGRWGSAFRASPEYNDHAFKDLHFDCNDVEVLIAPPEIYYGHAINFLNKDSDSPDTRNKLINCSAKDNVFRGSGGINHVFAFDAGYIDDATGLDIDLSGNTVTTPILRSVFRNSNAPLPD